MFVILNRLRGTYSYFAKVNGVLFGLVIYTIYGNIYVASAVAIGYIIGESFGWGEWVGTLTTNRFIAPQKIEEGKNNGIKWLASKIVPFVLWRRYCTAALTIRGFYWWVIPFASLCFVGIPAVKIIIALILISFSFPFACYLARKTKFKFKIWEYKVEGNWSRQEFYYGLMQDIIIGGLLWL